jgi:Mn-dependent DtxR family transcriptional regulator
VTRTIVRAPRRQRYLVVDQAIIDDERLSIAARGVLVMVLSKPDDWQVRVDDLRRRCKVGRDSMYNLLNELKDGGYVRYVANRFLICRTRWRRIRQIRKQYLILRRT